MQDARLDLRARDRQLVADRLERPALDDERRAAVCGLDVSPHLGERRCDPVDGAASERVVAGQLEAAALTREQSCEQTQGRARVAAVHRRVGLAQSAQPGAFDANRVDVLFVDGGPERPDGGDCRLGVGGAAEAPHERLALGNRADQDGPVRDRLVARHRNVPDERGGGLDPHSGRTAETTTP